MAELTVNDLVEGIVRLMMAAPRDISSRIRIAVSQQEWNALKAHLEGRGDPPIMAIRTAPLQIEAAPDRPFICLDCE